MDPEKARPSPSVAVVGDSGTKSPASVSAMENVPPSTAGGRHHSPPAPDELALALSLALSRSLHSHVSRTSRPPPLAPGIADPDPEAGDGEEEDSAYEEPDKLPYSKLRCLALVATVTGASFSNTLSVQAVIIILPSIGRDIGIPDSRLQWVVSAYSLTFGCFLLLWGRIADVFGKKAIFVLGSAWVTATTVANPFVSNEIAFHLFRGLQGLGAAANVPTAIGILGTTFPPGKAKTYAFTAYGAGAPLGSIFGNLIAGLIASYVNWKWVFGVLAIFIGVITVAGFLVIPNHPPPRHGPAPAPPNSPPAALNNGAPQPIEAAWFRSIDWIGGFLVTLGLVGLLFALTEGNVVGWSTPWVGVIIGLSVILVAGFVLWQLWLEKPHNCDKRISGHSWPPPPLVRMSIFTHSKDNSFATSLVIMAFFFSSFNGYLIYATYFYQDYQGLSAIQTTLRFIPTGVFGLITCFCVAPLLSRVPTYMILMTGNIAVCLSCLLLAVPIPADTTSYFAYGLEAMILAVIGADTSWPSLTLFVSRALPHEDQALGGGLVNMAGQVGRAIGLAIATAIQTSVMAAERGRSVSNVGPAENHDWATLKGIRAGHWFNFGTAVVSFLVVAIAFRGTGIVGKAPDRPVRSGVRSGDDTATTATPARTSSDAEARAGNATRSGDTQTTVPTEEK